MRTNTAARLRRVLVKRLTDTCDIYRAGNARGSMGERVYTRTLVASGVACRLIRTGGGQSGAGGNSVVAERETLTQGYRVVLAWGTAVQADDVIVIAGQDYQVTGVSPDKTDGVDVQVTVTKGAANG